MTPRKPAWPKPAPKKYRSDLGEPDKHDFELPGGKDSPDLPWHPKYKPPA